MPIIILMILKSTSIFIFCLFLFSLFWSARTVGGVGVGKAIVEGNGFIFLNLLQPDPTQKPFLARHDASR